MLFRTLRLLHEIDELVNSNKMLRETWSERRGSVYAHVKKSLAVTIRPSVRLERHLIADPPR
jgi:hypothetical protein